MIQFYCERCGGLFNTKSPLRRFCDECKAAKAPEPEPKKGGGWERVEIDEDDGQYCLVHPVTDVYVIDALPRIPGYGGIEYQSPFDPKVIVRSMMPLCFSFDGDWTFITNEHDRPGIPVAAWFWREVEK